MRTLDTSATPSSTIKERLVDLHDLEEWTRALLLASGLSAHHAVRAAGVFSRASARGVGHHDASYLPQRLEWLAAGLVNAKPAIKRVGGGAAAEVWDGDRGLGEVCCSHVTRRAVALARRFGIGYAVIRSSNHFLAASPYAEIGLEAGCFTLVFSNTDAGMSAPDGKKNLIGNNPLGFGMPLDNQNAEASMLLDVCLAYSSLGNLRAMVDKGNTVPGHWGCDADGQPTSDASAILFGGSVHPVGGHKGFGLALMVEMLTGALAGGHTGDQVHPGGGLNTHNQAVIAFDLGQFTQQQTPAGVEKTAIGRAGNLAHRLKKAQPGLRLPGDRSAKARVKAERDGVQLSSDTARRLDEWSHRLGVRIPEAF